jgi:hypothetical protein
MNEVKALLLAAIKLLDKESTQEAFKAQHNIKRAIESLPADKVSGLRAA